MTLSRAAEPERANDCRRWADALTRTPAPSSMRARRRIAPHGAMAQTSRTDQESPQRGELSSAALPLAGLPSEAVDDRATDERTPHTQTIVDSESDVKRCVRGPLPVVPGAVERIHRQTTVGQQRDRE